MADWADLQEGLEEWLCELSTYIFSVVIGILGVLFFEYQYSKESDHKSYPKILVEISVLSWSYQQLTAHLAGKQPIGTRQAIYYC